MPASYLSDLLSLRILVGFLGESDQFDWWPTKFYEASSRPFLEPVFSRTLRLAQYHGVLEAARLLHDKHLSVGSYHLFRLPEEIEQDLHAIVQSKVEDELGKMANLAKASALAELKLLGKTSQAPIAGPMAVGLIKDIDAPATLAAMAGAYAFALSQNVKTYPYLAG